MVHRKQDIENSNPKAYYRFNVLLPKKYLIEEKDWGTISDNSVLEKICAIETDSRA